jgi:FMN-dependent dehydrogenase
MSQRIDVINLDELEERARELLPQMAYDYYASGANDEFTLRENRAAYERIALLPRMLVDVSVRDMGTTVLGEPVSMPILIAPVALPGLHTQKEKLRRSRPPAPLRPLQPWRPFRPLRSRTLWRQLPGPSGSSSTCLGIGQSPPRWCNAPKPPVARRSY